MVVLHLLKPVSPEAAAIILEEFIKYLLYIKQQINCPYDDLIQFHQQIQTNQTSLKRKRRSSSSIKLNKFVSSSINLFSFFIELFSLQHVKQILILFGSSISNTKEVYRIELNHTFDEEIRAFWTPEKLDLLSKKFIRTLLSEPIFYEQLSPTKMHLMVLTHDNEFKQLLPQSKFHKKLKNQKQIQIIITDKSPDQNIENKEESTWEISSFPNDDFIWFRYYESLSSVKSNLIT